MLANYLYPKKGLISKNKGLLCSVNLLVAYSKMNFKERIAVSILLKSGLIILSVCSDLSKRCFMEVKIW